MMKKLIAASAALALVLAACSSGSGTEVASLEDTSDIADAAAEDVDSATANEEAILAFSQCMRDEGITDFEDPEISDDGAIEFRLGQAGQASETDRETMRAAFEACQGDLEGLAFGPGAIDRSEIEDTLLEFAVCMRENGIDMPDPDFSNLIPGQGGGQGNGPFGEIDEDDPDVQAAFEVCQEVFGGSLRFGGGPGGGGPGGGGDG